MGTVHSSRHEGNGIGKQLHRLMLDWYFQQVSAPLLLATEPNTRADGFYRYLGWRETGILENGDRQFIMHEVDWIQAP